ncbi:hypothetical protein [Actinokineospora globicatena]|uniref:hypothetical protein n=1 Tax=Actinokineospora globicatena TaxID=103729 RepID=UPI0020A36C92|nr:hypothetical protein [Actinokineospora globicatena]MCP2303223.1 hypothetical protein [Actinokineospora globicatena]GLW79654.1 hypothetical protein Aglo01_41350 [Actinokineospora globicatena]GLW85936.1 hypothetical protein Aglo02_35760 [Actinokineospora globicatena]
MDHEFEGPEDEALAAVVADWFVRVLGDAGVGLVPEAEDGDLLRDAVLRGLPVLFLGRLFPEKYDELRGELRAVFTSGRPSGLGASATGEDLRRLVAETVAPVVGHPFFRFGYRDLADVVMSLAHQVLGRVIAVGGLGRVGPVEGRRVAARLGELGFADLAEVFGANVLSGVVNGPVVQARVINGGVHLVVNDVEPGPHEDPVVATVSVHQEFGVVGTDGLKFAVSGHCSISIFVEARTARAVALTALRPVVSRRRQPQPTSGSMTLGALEVRYFRTMLDDDVPRLVPMANKVERKPVWLDGFFFRSARVADFPFAVAPMDPEMFVVEPITTKWETEFRFELDWIHLGRRGTTVIDNDGYPFLVAPRTTKAISGFGPPVEPASTKVITDSHFPWHRRRK